MSKVKIAITLEEKTLEKVDRLIGLHVFPNRSRAIQEAVEEKLERLEKNRLAKAGLRPVLVLSQDIFNERSGTVIAVALTAQAQRAGFPLTFELENTQEMKKSWVKISQIRTLAVERIGKKMGKASPEQLARVIEGLNEIIGT